MDRKIEKMIKLGDEIVMLSNVEPTEKNNRLLAIRLKNREKVKRIEEFDKEDSLRAINKLVNAIEGSNFELRKVDSAQYNDTDFDIFYLYREEDEVSIQLAYCKKDVDKIDYSDNFSKECDILSGVCAIDKEEYMYILDFMKYVTEYKLLKVDYDLCFEEFEQLINIFICNYMGANKERRLIRIKN